MIDFQKASRPKRILTGIILICLGLLGNYFNFPIFLNIDFIFGSVFSMLILQFFGIGAGVLSSILISSYTYILWNHPYAIIIQAAEMAVVGWLMSRRKMGMVLADTIYWLVIGMALVYLFYGGIMHVPFSNASIVMIKQTLNGITNALIARLIFTGIFLRFRTSKISYSELIYNLLSFFVLCPSLVMLAASSRGDFAEMDSHIRSSLIQDSENANKYLETWVANRESVVCSLAEMAATRSPQQMQCPLELVQKSDANFLRVGLLDREATITAYFPLIDELGQKNIGKNFADRPFIPMLKKTLKPMLSEVVMGRIGIPKPMITMLAPVIVNNEYNGYVTGILNLEQIREYLFSNVHGNSILYTLIDKNGSVIMTNRTDQQVMTHFVRSMGSVHALGNGIDQWVPMVPSNTSIMERWKKSFYVAETTIGNLAEWKLILEQPVAPFQKTLYNNYTRKFSELFLILILSMALAEFLSRKSIVTLEMLRRITQDFPEKLATQKMEIHWPESGIIESDHLITNFREMSDSLTRQFNELQQTEQELKNAYEEVESTVRKRTAELDATNASLTLEIHERKMVETALRESEEKYRVLFHNELYAVSIFDLETLRFLDMNDACVNLYGYSRDELINGMTIHDVTVQQEETDRAVRQAVSKGTVYIPLRYLKKKDGTVFPVEIVGGPYTWKGKRVIFSVVRDITDRKRSEAALVESENKFKSFSEKALVGIYLIQNDVFLYVNPKFAEIFGYSIEACLNPMTFHRLVYEEDRPLVAEQIRKRLSGEVDDVHYTFRGLRQDGRIIDVEAYGSTISLNGKTAAIGTILDITDRQRAQNLLKKSETRYRLLADNATDVIWTTGLDFKITFASPSVTKLLGYTVKEVISLSANQIFSPADYENVLNFFSEELEIEKSGIGDPNRSRIMEFDLVHKDGHIVPIEGNYSFLRDSNGRAIGVLGITRDITERKHAENALKIALQEKETLLREIHHRVKNNMQVISSLIQLQAGEAENESTQKALLETQQRINAMALIHEALYKTKNFAFLNFPVYFSGIINQLNEVYSTKANIKISSEIENIDLNIEQAIPCGLIVNELITNAFKHAFPNGADGLIQIRLRHTDDEEIELTVRDNGVGLNDGQDFKNPGSLGLKLIQGLLKHQLHGHLTIDGQNGTSFILRWPHPAVKDQH